MTPLEIFGLAAPIAITALGWLYCLWLVRH